MNSQSPTIQTISSGATQRGLRDYNERLILSMIQRNGALPGSEVARHAGLSPQTVSLIMRKLEADGLLAKGMPLRAGRVGKPSVPMDLAADGAFSFGLDVGRRGANLVLMDFQSTKKTDRIRTPV